MSILASLASAYDRLPNVPKPGYSTEKIGFVISLNEDGTVANVTDLREGDGNKKRPRMMQVPASFKRPGTAPKPFFLWDNAGYALGVTASPEAEEIEKVRRKFDAFRQMHHAYLVSTTDIGLWAMLRFLENWNPERFTEEPWPTELLGSNVVFAFEAERRKGNLHDRPAARELWGNIADRWKEVAGKRSSEAVCLVTGILAPISRTHPAIKGIRSKGGKDADSIVSFNEAAYKSYGHEQGDNAPISELAAFKYVTALNTFLAGKTNRLQIGDASTVFWADASEARTAEVAESVFRFVVDERTESDKVKTILSRVRQGRVWSAALKGLDPGLYQGVRFHVLGLSPNAARISVRFWFDDDFGVLAENYAAYISDMSFEPWPDGRGAVGIRRLTLRTAPARQQQNRTIKFDGERVSSLLSGELFRAIVSGGRFPAGLLSLLLLRVRTDGILDSVRVALIKAILVRTMRLGNRLPKDANNKAQEDYLVRSDPNDPNPARRLGRLFAIVERAQLAALGDEINATVKDKYLGTAAATPSRVMSKLVLNAEQHHIKRLRNGHSDAKWISDSDHARRVGAGLHRDIGQLFASFNDTFPSQHSSEEQAYFLVGYYQERFGPKGGGVANDLPDDIDVTEASEETPE